MKSFVRALPLLLLILFIFSCSNVVNNTGIPESLHFPTSRNPYQWGSTYDSPWNLPLSVDAKFAPVGSDVGGDLKTPIGLSVDGADLSISTSFPIKTLSWENNGTPGSAQVYCDPTLSADGTWNNCGAFLCADGVSIIEGQTTMLNAGEDPKFDGSYSYAFAPYNLKTTQGIKGSHGGSHLSCLGGTLRVVRCLFSNQSLTK